MKINKTNILKKAINCKWQIDYFDPSNKRKGKSNLNEMDFQIGSQFKLETKPGSNTIINGITFKQPKSRKRISLPLFMGIKPTYYIKENTFHIVFLIGTEPCDLHHLILTFDHFEDKHPIFTFVWEKKFEKCKCDDDCAGTGTARLKSGHGIGGGTGRN